MGTALDPSESAVRRDADERLLEAVNRLPAKERLVIGLRYFLELSEQEIANVAGVPKGTVKSRTARAMTRLRDSIGEVDV
jgi:RNA polymerase sigma-70 factor (ECF subfamily)